MSPEGALDPTRRTILGGAAAAGLLGGCPHRKTGPDRVVVVGGGLAGLCCALELHRRGHPAQVFEASDRIGGRVLTQRNEGMTVDVGATRILANHDLVHRYADTFGLPCVPWLVRPEVMHVANHRRVVVGRDWPDDLSAAESVALADGQLYQRYLASAQQRVGDPLRPGWPPEELADLDAHTYPGYLRSQGASDAAIALLTHGSLGGWSDRLGILQNARFGLLNDFSGPITRIDGGNDRLAQAFARALPGAVRLSSAVREIRVARDGTATVTIEAGGMLSSIEADAVVLALPLSALRRIELHGTSGETQRAVQQLAYVEVTRTPVSFPYRFWETRNLPGRVRSDLPIQEFWPADQPDARGVLSGYTTGAEAVVVGHMERDILRSFLEDQLSRSFGQRRRPAMTLLPRKAWHDDPWIGGGWPTFGPDQGWLLRHLQRPDGPLWFAGDHASPWPGWMQGALYSGETVAAQILDGG